MTRRLANPSSSQGVPRQTAPGALVILLCAALLATLWAPSASASSHREAPGITRSPQVDGTDFYMFRSYEPSREGYVTLIANYNPLQDPSGGPNFYPLDSNAAYDIHVNNDADITEDITFRFQFRQALFPITLPVGPPDDPTFVQIPLVNVGPFGPGFGLDLSRMSLVRSFTLEVIRGDVNSPTSRALVLNPKARIRFGVPFDNIGAKSIPNYAAYANIFIHQVEFPGCATDGRVFVGQRRESFAVNLGETFDLVNLNPLGPVDGERSSTEDKNITSLALEVPIDCLTGDSNIIGGWTTARLPRTRVLQEASFFEQPDLQSGDLVQVSRLAMPLVNELVVPLQLKNLFNASHPRSDAQFLPAVTHPTLPELLEILFPGVTAPNNFPRNDLVWTFVTGIPGLTEDGSVGEVMRLNTSIGPTLRNNQSNLGVAAGDNAGYPNGRRPGDDVVDISLRAVMGVLCHLDLGVCEPADAPSGNLPFTDGAIQNAQQFSDAFPYLTTPIPGSPNP